MPDKYFECWRLVYALAARAPNNIVIAVIGTSQKTIEQLVSRLQSEKSSTRETRIGRYLAQVREIGAPCYLWPLESHFDDLDQISAVKQRWILSGEAAGVVFPQNPLPYLTFDSFPISYPHKPWLSRYRDPETLRRTWPNFSEVASSGLRIR